LTEPTTTDGAAGEQASADSSTEPSRVAESDFKARAQTDPDFAWNQVQQFQSRADKLQGAEEKYNKLVEQMGPAKDLIEKYGGKTVADATNLYGTWRSQEVSDVVQAFEQTGQLPARKGSASNDDDDGDEYMTDEEKEIASLRGELAQIKQRQSEQSLTTGQAAIRRHIEKVAHDYDFDDGDFDKMKKAVVTQIEAWSKAGDVGERALDALAREDGFAQVQGLMLQQVTPEVLQKAANRAALRKQGKLTSIATDSPGRIASDGKEPPPKFASYAEAALWAENNPDAHDAY
jgi:hypothetical protein